MPVGSDVRKDLVDEDAIFNALSDLGLAHNRRRSTRGVPYAGFRLVAGGDVPDVSVTAIAEEGVLRLTSHAIATPASALDVVRLGSRLPLGAAYRSPDDGSAELSVGVRVGGAPLPRELVARLLTYLVDATAMLSTGAPAPALVDVRDLASGVTVDVPAALAQYGHRLTPEGGGHRLQVPLSAAVGCSILLREVAEGWVSASATYVPERRLRVDDSSLGELQALQRWATSGRFVLDQGLVLGAEVMTPLLGPPEPTVVWTTSQSVALLQTAARHLQLMA